jgi:hypothetical protein
MDRYDEELAISKSIDAKGFDPLTGFEQTTKTFGRSLSLGKYGNRVKSHS